MDERTEQIERIMWAFLSLPEEKQAEILAKAEEILMEGQQ